jgi:peroxiredoxin
MDAIEPTRGIAKELDDSLNMIAPDFSAEDIDGRNIVLSKLRGEKNVLLVFNRGFT